MSIFNATPGRYGFAPKIPIIVGGSSLTATHFFISLKKKPFELKSALKVALLGLRLRHGGHLSVRHCQPFPGRLGVSRQCLVCPVRWPLPHPVSLGRDPRECRVRSRCPAWRGGVRCGDMPAQPLTLVRVVSPLHICSLGSSQRQHGVANRGRHPAGDTRSAPTWKSGPSGQGVPPSGLQPAVRRARFARAPCFSRSSESSGLFLRGRLSLRRFLLFDFKFP